MAGHSKWKQIKHKKGANDSKRAKIFTKLIRELVTATRQGGADPSMNSRLRLAIQKAKDANMPGDTLDKAIKRGSGDGEEENYEEMVYEGYGPGGAGLIVEVLTDNKNRTAADIRHIFSKYGGAMGAPGSVSYNFERVGQLFFAKSAYQEEFLMELVMDSGADDMRVEDEEYYEVNCAPEMFHSVREFFDEKQVNIEESGIVRRPKTKSRLTGDDLVKMFKLLNMMEDNDDVQEVYHNFDGDELEIQKIMENF
ncbi:MAG: YebC/PmpR family DNA-binding transcriptional regulator [Candidatus Cloacimonetes bacterium]|nr:YebC/PmpR family DNA-binding transcriptional regulator [Candidatus Cloacimonadota bacterium]